jgi:hypothetical protein
MWYTHSSRSIQPFKLGIAPAVSEPPRDELDPKSPLRVPLPKAWRLDQMTVGDRASRWRRLDVDDSSFRNDRPFFFERVQ